MGNIRAATKRQRWTDDEIARLSEAYERTPRSELNLMFPNREIRSIECKANALGLLRQKTPKMTDKERLRRKREGMARKRAADPEAARAYRNSYHAANRSAQTKKMREYSAKRFFWRKSMSLRGSQRASASELSKLWKSQRGMCALTGRRLDRSAQLDHKIPKAKGGGDSLANLQWLCQEANLAKRDMTDEQFAALCADVMQWIGYRLTALMGVRHAAN